jgi:hypothetical protein
MRCYTATKSCHLTGACRACSAFCKISFVYQDWWRQNKTRGRIFANPIIHLIFDVLVEGRTDRTAVDDTSALGMWWLGRSMGCPYELKQRREKVIAFSDWWARVLRNRNTSFLPGTPVWYPLAYFRRWHERPLLGNVRDLWSYTPDNKTKSINRRSNGSCWFMQFGFCFKYLLP